MDLKNKLLRKNKKHSAKNKSLHVHHGEVQHIFYSPEFLDYERGPIWYLVAGIIAIAILSFGILTNTITLTIAFLVFVAVYWIMHHKEARAIETAITKYGIRYGKDFFSFGEIKNFWIIYKPPFVADLKIHVKRKWGAIITIHIFGQDPVALRALISPHVEEIKDREESTADLLIRALRL